MGVQNYTYDSGAVAVWHDKNQDSITVKDSAVRMREIRFPYQYWNTADRENVPEDAQVLRHGSNIAIGAMPTSEGIVSIQFNERELKGMTVFDLLLKAVQMIKEQKEGYHSRLFQLFVPISTRSGSDLFKSLFPCNGFLKDDRADHIQVGTAWKVASVIVDLVTLIFRLIALIPRALYQRYGIKNTPIERRGDVTINVSQEINWGEGVIALHAAVPADPSQQTNERDRQTFSKPQQGVCIYLG